MYSAHHENELPPSIIPNSEIPAENCLSGFVLLLPYFGEKPDYLDDESWEKFRIPVEEAEAAKELFEKLDLKKGWDDAANLEAAKTRIPVFQFSDDEQKQDEAGHYNSHFAFVLGYGGRKDGAFPGSKVKIYDPTSESDWIADGTLNTLAVGQVIANPGPWTAAGESTSRFVYHPSVGETISFGSKFEQACYFSKCDGGIVFLDLANSTPVGLNALVTRAGDDKTSIAGNVRIYNSVEEWEKAKR